MEKSFVVENGILNDYVGKGRNVIIPEGVTGIGDYAFEDCSSLTSITIPGNVTSIGDCAFGGCRNLTSITIPNSVTSIGDYAFGGCRNLTSITIPNSVTSIGDDAFVDCSNLADITIPGSVTSIERGTFSGCGNLTSITIPDSVISIGDRAFADCSNLTSITIPGSVTSIGDYAFIGCDKLTSVTIPDSVTKIGESVFARCAEATVFNITESGANRPENFKILKNGELRKYNGLGGDVTIPDIVTGIAARAFAGCSSLMKVTIPRSVTSIGDYAFIGCDKLTSITIPDSVTSIGDYAFIGCNKLTIVTIPDSVTKIGKGAFASCAEATVFNITESGANRPENFKILENGELRKYNGLGGDVTIPDIVTGIAARAFAGCNSLMKVTIPRSVTKIGDCAFENCGSLTSITIPGSVTSIGDCAFEGCRNLTSIIIPDSVTSIESGAFKGCSNLTSITIPDSVTSIERGAFKRCRNLTSITIPDSVTSIERGAFEECSSLTSITIPNSVTSIGSGAFEECRSLTSITIPNSVTSIGSGAFEECRSLTSITIPNSVTSIGSGAFKGCSNLTSITIPNSVTSIEYFAFLGCSSLTSITIPDSVTSIERGAFEECRSLTSITIPDSVISIGEDVFSGCKNLENIIFSKHKFKFKKYPFGNINYGGGIPKGLKDKCFSLVPRFTDAMLKEYILETDLWGTMTAEQQAEIFVSRQSKTLNSGYMQCITDDQLETLGNALEDCLNLKKKPSARECAAVALYMTGFKDKIPAEKLRTLYELLQPVKAASKALVTIDNDLVLKEKLGQELIIDEDLGTAERLVMEKLISDKKSQQDLEDQLKEYYGITYADLPSVMGKDGKEKEPYVLAWLLQAHENIIHHGNIQETAIKINKNVVNMDAKKVLDELDDKSFQMALLELSGKFLEKYVNTKKKYLCYPISRYADEATLSEITKDANKWRTSTSGIDAPPLRQLRTGCLYNNTRAAMLFAERYHDLDRYATIRGTDADTLRNTVLSEFDFDETGKKQYDLGNTTLEVELQDDLTIRLYDQGAQKTVKSVPKRKADPEKYEAAKKDVSNIRKNVKKVAKARNNALFEDFLNGKEYESKNWTKVHFSNPLLNRVARLLVWAQGEDTFTLSAEGAIDSTGLTYSITDKPIRLAHPMEMRQAEVEAWQKYYTSHGLKQPFAQVWEPVISPDSVKKDRYSGIVLPLMHFKGRERHGIVAENFEAYSEFFYVEFKDCDLELEPNTWRIDPYGDYAYTYTLGEFSFKNYTRYTNHIVGILDSWTVEQRILKDDVSVANSLESFTLAQITEFINRASEHNCNNVTAALLEYKNNHFAGFDPMESFWLEDF